MSEIPMCEPSECQVCGGTKEILAPKDENLRVQRNRAVLAKKAALKRVPCPYCTGGDE